MCEPDFGGVEDGRSLHACGVVRVKVDRDANFLSQGFDELASGERFTEPGHVLNGEEMRAAFLEVFGEVDVVFEVVLGAFGIENIAGVADGGFADAAGVDDGLHGDFHVRRPVERIEDAEDIDAGLCGFFDEELDDVVGIVGVADGVACAEQHLEKDVRRFFAHIAEATPRAFFEESHRRIESGAAPHFEREEVRALAGVGFGDCQANHAYGRGSRKAIDVRREMWCQ